MSWTVIYKLNHLDHADQRNDFADNDFSAAMENYHIIATYRGLAYVKLINPAGAVDCYYRPDSGEPPPAA